MMGSVSDLACVRVVRGWGDSQARGRRPVILSRVHADRRLAGLIGRRGNLMV